MALKKYGSQTSAHPDAARVQILLDTNSRKWIRYWKFMTGCYMHKLSLPSIDIESFLTWKFGHSSRRHLAVSKEIDLFHFIRSRSCTRVSRGSDYYVNFQISRLIHLWWSLLVFIEAGNISFFKWKLLG